jgi:hypothetical protein
MMTNPAQKEVVFNLLLNLYSLCKAEISISSFDTFTISEPFELNEHIIGILKQLNDHKDLLGSLKVEVDFEEIPLTSLTLDLNCTHLSISANKSRDPSPIFFAPSAEAFINKYSPFLAKGECLPSYYYLIEEGYSSTSKEEPTWLNNLYVVQGWFKLFKSLADIEKETDNGELVYFIAKKDKDKYLKHTELELLLDFSFTQIQNIPKLGEFESLLNGKSDLHTEERKVFFKQALVEALSDLRDEEIVSAPVVKSLLENIEKLTASYHEQVQVFIQNFALNEFHNEVENKYFEYLESINKTVGDVQAKMFAVPASLIGIGALLKATNWLSYSFIIFGIFLVCLFSQFIISEQFSRFKQIQDSINFIFRKLKEEGIQQLDKTKVIKEVRQMKGKLGDAIEAKKDRLIWYAIFIWINLLLAPIAIILKSHVIF